MKWMISMNTWITIIFGTESVIQVFIEIIHSTDEKKKNLIYYFVDKNILYRVHRWSIELHICVIIYKWDYLFLIVKKIKESIIVGTKLWYFNILNIFEFLT